VYECPFPFASTALEKVKQPVFVIVAASARVLFLLGGGDIIEVFVDIEMRIRLRFPRLENALGYFCQIVRVIEKEPAFEGIAPPPAVFAIQTRTLGVSVPGVPDTFGTYKDHRLF
jgi:hypothetical protein